MSTLKVSVQLEVRRLGGFGCRMFSLRKDC